MSDVFTEITALLDAEDASIQTALDAENQRHEGVTTALRKRQQDLAQVRITLDELQAQAVEPTPAPADTETPVDPTVQAGDAAAATPDGSEAAAAVTPDPQAAAAAPVEDTVEVTSASTGAVAVVPATDLAAATDPSVPDAALTPPQQALRNSDYK